MGEQQRQSFNHMFEVLLAKRICERVMGQATSQGGLRILGFFDDSHQAALRLALERLIEDQRFQKTRTGND